MGYVVGGRVRSLLVLLLLVTPSGRAAGLCSISARSSWTRPSPRNRRRPRGSPRSPSPKASCPWRSPRTMANRPSLRDLAMAAPRTMTTLARWTPCSKRPSPLITMPSTCLQIAHVYRDLGFAEDAYAWAARGLCQLAATTRGRGHPEVRAEHPRRPGRRSRPHAGHPGRSRDARAHLRRSPGALSAGAELQTRRARISRIVSAAAQRAVAKYGG